MRARKWQNKRSEKKDQKKKEEGGRGRERSKRAEKVGFVFQSFGQRRLELEVRGLFILVSAVHAAESVNFCFFFTFFHQKFETNSSKHTSGILSVIALS